MEKIIFCPRCSFQDKLTGLGMAPTCPECKDGTRLHTITLDTELEGIIRIENE